jgi:hypothetical protein
MEDCKIVLIQDLLDSRRRKQKELEFYLSKKVELEKKLLWLQRDLALTDHILQLIEKEGIKEII